MKKYIAFAVLVALVASMLTSCFDFGMDPNEPFYISYPDIEPAVGDKVELQAKYRSTDKRAKGVLWSSSDTAVAEIDSEGVVTVNGGGMCTLSAVHKDNLQNRAYVTLFCPYDTAEPIDGAIYAVGENVDGNFQQLVDEFAVWAVSMAGKNIVYSVTGQLSNFSFISAIFSFFKKDEYWFSMFSPTCVTDDTVLYTLVDWTNEDITVDPWEIASEDIYSELGYMMDLDYECGASFDTVRDKLRNQLSVQLPRDKTYYLAEMDDAYEYRVVVRADISASVMLDFYNNGLITGLGYSISDILSWDIQSLADNYSYQKHVNDIIDVADVRVCVERRAKYR